MATSQTCPEICDLKLLVLGQLPESAAEQLGQHILTCSTCATRLDSLLAGDPLLPELAAAPTQQAPDDPLVDALIARLLAQPPGRDALATPSNATTRVETTAAVAPSLSVPGYLVLEELGRGGQSVVYKARQLTLDRLVALKVISAIADVGERERFRRETEAVAHLEHPHIVRIYDVGEQAGQPYCALEFLAGDTLAKKLAGLPQPPAQAAGLLETLARTMDWAHQRGIVHRDLKPGNVLLTADGTPKIADFGLAKRLQGPGNLTHTGLIVGTPSYMAPEQAAGKNKEVGPAADVYALGGILYEMLTGRPPFLGQNTYDTLTQVLSQEPVSPRRLQPKVPRDLETIALKCLQKAPTRRYASAAALADDLGRFCRGEPIQARPVSGATRLVKWAQRRPTVAALSGGLLVATLALIGALVLGILFTTDALAQARQAEQQAKVAEKAEAAQRGEAEKRLVNSLNANEIMVSIFRDLNPRLEEKGGPPLSAQLGERLDKAAELLEGEAVGNPLLVARFQLLLGLSQLHLGYPQRAIILYTKARRVYEVVLGADHPDTLSLMDNLAQAYLDNGELAKALPLFEETWAKQKAKLGADHPDTLITMHNLANAYQSVGQVARALPLLEESLKKSKAREGADSLNTLAAMYNLAGAYQRDGQLAKALPLFEETWAKQKAKLGADHHDTLTTMHNLAVAYQEAGQLAKALPLLEDTLAKQKAKLGADHPHTLITMGSLAVAYQFHGQLARALPLLEDTLAKQTVKLGADHPNTLTTMYTLARVYQDIGELAKALPLLEQTLEKRQAKLGADHPDTLISMGTLAVAYQFHGQLAKALPLLEDTLAKQKVLLGANHLHTLTTMNYLAGAFEQTKTFDKAEPLRRDLLKVYCTKFGPEHTQTASALVVLGNVLLQQQKYAEAEAPLREGADLRAKLQPKTWSTFIVQSLLGAALLGQKKYADAEPVLLKGYEGMKQCAAQIPAVAKFLLVESAQRLVDLYEAWDRPESAAQWRKTMAAERAQLTTKQP